MNLKSITLPQALVFVACLAATFAAYKFLGPEAATVSSLASMLLHLMLQGGGSNGGGGSSSGGGSPDLKVIDGGKDSGAQRRMLAVVGTALVAFLISACGAALPALDDPELTNVAAKLAKCRGEARAYVQTSEDPQSRETALAAYTVYEQCKSREGVPGAAPSKDGGQ